MSGFFDFPSRWPRTFSSRKTYRVALLVMVNNYFRINNTL
jgi:hypothetical protein